MGNLGPTEIILILLILVLLFGAKKLPELARGSGRALRIFKAETKGLMDDEDEKSSKDDKDAEPSVEEKRQISSTRVDNGTYDPSTSTAHPTPPTAPSPVDNDR